MKTHVILNRPIGTVSSPPKNHKHYKTTMGRNKIIKIHQNLIITMRIVTHRGHESILAIKNSKLSAQLTK